MLDIHDPDVQFLKLIKAVPVFHHGARNLGYTAAIVMRSFSRDLREIGGPMLFARYSCLASFCGKLLCLCGRLLLSLPRCRRILLVLVCFLVGVVFVPLSLAEIVAGLLPLRRRRHESPEDVALRRAGVSLGGAVTLSVGVHASSERKNAG